MSNARASRRRALRTRNRARNTRRRRTRYVRYRSPFGATAQYAKLVYHTSISLDPKPDQMGATATNVWQFSGNGCYDADITSTGHQPMFFDNYAALFRRYNVHKSSISVTVVNHAVNTATWNGTNVTTTPNYSYRLFILKEGTNGFTTEYPGSMSIGIEEANANMKWRYIAPSLNGRLPRLKNSITPHRLLGLSKSDDTLSANTSSNPSSACYYYVGITSADGVTDPPSVYLSVTLTFYVKFFDREVHGLPRAQSIDRSSNCSLRSIAVAVFSSVVLP